MTRFLYLTLILTILAIPASAADKPFAGPYLVSQFAQSNHDWQDAFDNLKKVIKISPQEEALLNRGMILAVGVEDIDAAAGYAEDLLEIKEDDQLALFVLAVNAFAKGKEEDVVTYLDRMPAGELTDFVRPVLQGWAHVADGKLEVEGMEETLFHTYHAALIALQLGKQKEALEIVTERLEAQPNMNEDEIIRIGDVLVLAEMPDEALRMYEKVEGSEDRVKEIIELLKNKQSVPDSLLPAKEIKSARGGAAHAIYDMAFVLYEKQSPSSARLFSHMALILDPNLTRARLFLAHTLAGVERYEEAISYLESIPEDYKDYLEIQRYIADLMADSGQVDEARKRLNKLFVEYDDVESLIRIGDLYRSEERYDNALRAYNKAVKTFGDSVPENYWYLLYARGMAYEREGIWDKAEEDLKAALVYRPNHPYLLNYLGYGWADQGLKLDKALDLIKQAVSLQPTDGYIIDSLGWVHYMMGDYEDSVRALERAVSILPYDPTINDHLGDAYWQDGRKHEARFQWQRAYNYAEEEELKQKITTKLEQGLEKKTVNAKQASSTIKK